MLKDVHPYLKQDLKWNKFVDIKDYQDLINEGRVIFLIKDSVDNNKILFWALMPYEIR